MVILNLFKSFFFNRNFIPGWYSSGVFLLSKTIVDLLPICVSIAIYCWIIDLYSSFKTYIVYLSINLIMSVCAQSIAQISAIVSSEDTKTSLLIGYITILLIFILSNNFILIKELHYVLQVLSSLSYMRLTSESFFIWIYGFDRCDQNEISTVLMTYEIKTEDFWPNVIQVIIICILLKTLTLFVLIIKTNSLFEWKRKTYENVQDQKDDEESCTKL